MLFNFNMPVRVIGEKNAVLLHSNELAHFGKKAFIVCGKGSAVLSGAIDDVKNALEREGVGYFVFDKITQNPKASDCFEAGKAARELGSDFIIGIGGGSQLDAAKAAAVYASADFSRAEEIYTAECKRSPLPTVLVGTTAGTGSEVTAVSVLTRENGRKKSVSGPAYFAKLAFADPKYTYSVPYFYTVSTAVDALSHAVESLFSKKSDVNSELYARAAIPPILYELKKMSQTGECPDESGRDRLYCASLLAGMALNITGTCFPHTLGYALTEQFSVPHGFACAAFLPAFLERAESFLPERACGFYNLTGETHESFTRLLSSLNRLENVRFTEDVIDSYCEGWKNVKNFDNSPGGFNCAEAKALLSRLFG
ncbi:MAG: iron-containing alcohol dehydrogenase [Clostridia bacterium]|nr:iron-containing alcohol dehydrogenase [Clostridia bacterium]